MDTNSILNEILKALIIAGVPILLTGLGYLGSYLRAWIEAKTKNQWLIVLEREAFTVVSALNQKLAAPIKEAAKDGRLTAEEANDIKQRAKAILWESFKDIPKHLFPDLGQRVETLIESQVSQIKVAAQNPTETPAKEVLSSKPGETI